MENVSQVWHGSSNYPFGEDQTMQMYGNLGGFPLWCIVWVGNRMKSVCFVILGFSDAFNFRGRRSCLKHIATLQETRKRYPTIRKGISFPKKKNILIIPVIREILLPPPKTNMTLEHPPWMKMYFLLKMEMFQLIMLVFFSHFYVPTQRKAERFSQESI